MCDGGTHDDGDEGEGKKDEGDEGFHLVAVPFGGRLRRVAVLLPVIPIINARLATDASLFGGFARYRHFHLAACAVEDVSIMPIDGYFRA